MKGDERVQTVEERTDSALLINSWDADLRFKEIIWSNVEHPWFLAPSAAIN